MPEWKEVEEAIQPFKQEGHAEILSTLSGTHGAFEVRMRDQTYVFRQYNKYTLAQDLDCQFRLAELLHAAGLQLAVPLSTPEGAFYVQSGGHFWALFPWIPGKSGQRSSIEDLKHLVVQQGEWVRSHEEVRSHPDWERIARAAARFRRRKPWAWVVALDRISAFAREYVFVPDVIEPLKQNLPQLRDGQLLRRIEEAVDNLDAVGMGDGPHMVTHGDFWVSNIRISDRGCVLLDLDCYSYEPRMADFARAANWYMDSVGAEELARLFRLYQERAGLAQDEATRLPVLMAAHNLYYAVSHLLFLLGDEDGEERETTLSAIEHDIRKAEERLNGKGPFGQ